MGEKFDAFKEKVSNGAAKVVNFTRRHPVLTIVASNIAVGLVSGGVAYAKTKRDMMSVGGEEALKVSDTEREIGKHTFIAGEGYFYDNELDKSYRTGVPSDRINDIVQGIERMNLDNGDAIMTMKTGENSYESIMIEEPDVAILTMNDIVRDFDGHCNRYR